MLGYPVGRLPKDGGFGVLWEVTRFHKESAIYPEAVLSQFEYTASFNTHTHVNVLTMCPGTSALR